MFIGVQFTIYVGFFVFYLMLTHPCEASQALRGRSHCHPKGGIYLHRIKNQKELTLHSQSAVPTRGARDARHAVRARHAHPLMGVLLFIP